MVETRIIGNDSIVGEVFIEASPEAVFAALTDPKKLATWWGDDATYHADQWTIDLRVGGKWRSEGKSVQGQAFTVEGEYLEIDPPRVLAYTWRPSWTETPPTRVRFELTAEKNGTRLEVTHSGFSGYENARQNHAMGWPTVLGWLQKFAEQR